jgi:hypothetical protein
MSYKGISGRNRSGSFLPKRAFKCQGFVSSLDISLLAGVALFAVSLLGGSGYVIHRLHQELGVAGKLLPLPDPSPSVTVTTDMLRVTSIALGRPRLAVVNGVELTEGQPLEVKAGDGTAILRLTRIEDGTVTFKLGGQTFSAKLCASFPKKLH